MGGIIFTAHLFIFMLGRFDLPRWATYWLPCLVMLAAIAALLYRARGTAVLPRSVAERPVWSIWLGYLASLGVINLELIIGRIELSALFPIAAALSGFGFIAMSGHVWGGSAIYGLMFLIVSLLAAIVPQVVAADVRCHMADQSVRTRPSLPTERIDLRPVKATASRRRQPAGTEACCPNATVDPCRGDGPVP